MLLLHVVFCDGLGINCDLFQVEMECTLEVGFAAGFIFLFAFLGCLLDDEFVVFEYSDVVLYFLDPE